MIFSPPFPTPSLETPRFSNTFQTEMATLLAWRRDVRRFTNKPVRRELLDHLLDMAQLSPSVGNSQPWRWVNIESVAARTALRENFASCSAAALANYGGESARLYTQLKLQGLDCAPVQLAVFCDRETVQGSGLGKQTMPETLDHSVAGMISNLWLYARAFGLGLGWVSIVDPEGVKGILDVPDHWKLIACLCLGWPEEEHIDPELERFGWQERTNVGRQVLVR